MWCCGRSTAGEKLFVDWAGPTIPVYQRTTGLVWQASLFVAVLGASSYTYAEATRDQQMESGFRRTSTAFEFYGGVPSWSLFPIMPEPASPEPAATILT